MTEELGWRGALADDQIGIKGPGKVTDNGPDYATYDTRNYIITAWDAKYDSNRKFPAQLSLDKLDSWLPYLKAAVDDYTGPYAAQIRAAFAKGNIEGDIFVYYAPITGWSAP
jgi:hypothetical protein